MKRSNEVVTPLSDPDTSLLTLKEACQALKISEATGRNWIKKGKLQVTALGGKRMITNQDLQTLLMELEQGDSTRLKSRRNKRYASGHQIPKNYLADRQALQSVQDLVGALSAYSLTDEIMRLILCGIALKLLMLKGLIANPNGGNVLVAFIADSLPLGELKPLFDDLLPEHQRWSIPPDLLKVIHSHEPEQWISGDYLGLVYTALRCLRERKNTGAYFTPEVTAQKVAEHLVMVHTLKSDCRILDPCVGTGQLLLAALAHLSTAKRKESSHAYQNLYGYDCDALSIQLLRLNLVLTTGVVSLETLYSHFLIQDTLCADPAMVFDVIIGNPPWGSEFSPSHRQGLKRSYTLAERGSIESYALFIEWAKRYLAHDGLLVYLLPEACMTVKSHRWLRQFMKSHFHIAGALYLDNSFSGVYMPTVSLALKNNTGLLPDRICVVDQTAVRWLQTSRWTPDDSLLLRPNERDWTIMKQIEAQGTESLKGYADFGLGVVTGNNKQALLSRTFGIGEPVITGTDIEPYLIKPLKYALNPVAEPFQQRAPEAIYRAPEKLVYRFVAKQLIVASDKSQRLTLNSCNCLVPRHPKYSIPVILGLLNSQVLNTYYRLRFPSIKVLRSAIEQLPLPSLSVEHCAEIEKLVDDIQSTKAPIVGENSLSRIDDIVAKAYGLRVEQSLVFDR